MNIGTRLKEERERLGFNQEAFAALGAASKRSQIEWEKGTASPNAVFLATVAAHGVDARYVLTGDHESAVLPADEKRLLALFRLAEPGVRQAVLAALAAGGAPVVVSYDPAANQAQALRAAEGAPGPVRIRRGGMSVEIHGDVGQRIEGGSHPGATFSVAMGKGKVPTKPKKG